MHKEGIDFIIVSYCKHDYVRLCVESIKKFVDIPHTIHIVVNYLEGKSTTNTIKRVNNIGWGRAKMKQKK